MISVHGLLSCIIYCLRPLFALFIKNVRGHIRYGKPSLSTLELYLSKIYTRVEVDISNVLPKKNVIVFIAQIILAAHCVAVFGTYPAKICAEMPSGFLALSPLEDEMTRRIDVHIRFSDLVLEVFGNSLYIVIALTHDNWSVNRSMCNKMEKPLLDCASHRFHLNIKSLFQQMKLLCSKSPNNDKATYSSLFGQNTTATTNTVINRERNAMEHHVWNLGATQAIAWACFVIERMGYWWLVMEPCGGATGVQSSKAAWGPQWCDKKAPTDRWYRSDYTRVLSRCVGGAQVVKQPSGLGCTHRAQCSCRFRSSEKTWKAGDFIESVGESGSGGIIKVFGGVRGGRRSVFAIIERAAKRLRSIEPTIRSAYMDTRLLLPTSIVYEGFVLMAGRALTNRRKD